ncbi:DUF2155 domain-containing protein [Roseomonas fluvialis]|uniref:DUF2155 domain-containing protein n=1 Tax=Roseomonas fluvialis TaxID=1750527 RepID=A0ABN6P679_9PROT|nr:DUF2155 domain-containing protein [Roseomonas fluvialis]BDG73971.1 hypothetical protein Rmf_39000 [Roseomonas fluvialis]
MRRALVALVLASLPAAAVLAPIPAAAQDWVPMRAARLQALDKVTARITILEARVNESATFGTLSIALRSCNGRGPDDVPDAAAWMEITDSRAAPGSPPAFRGWMFANAPGVSMLEHPVYDIRVLECR